MKRGFEFAETMSGTFERTDGAGGGHIRFDAVVAAPSVWGYLRDRRCRITGTLDMDGVATGAALEGEMMLAPLVRRVIGYDFTFVGDDGRPYRFNGQKNIKFSNFRRSIANLPATLTDVSGRLVARCEVHFDLDSDLPAFLASWRPA